MTLIKIVESVSNIPSYLVQVREGYKTPLQMKEGKKSYIEVFFKTSFNEIEIHLTKQNINSIFEMPLVISFVFD